MPITRCTATDLIWFIYFANIYCDCWLRMWRKWVHRFEWQASLWRPILKQHDFSGLFTVETSKKWKLPRHTVGVWGTRSSFEIPSAIEHFRGLILLNIYTIYHCVCLWYWAAGCVCVCLWVWLMKYIILCLIVYIFLHIYKLSNENYIVCNSYSIHTCEYVQVEAYTPTFYLYSNTKKSFGCVHRKKTSEANWKGIKCHKLHALLTFT